tara:strand:- start:889 stop:1170 length:282 start_codon:yes stop_codon:yes gene_type:complete
MESVYSYRVYYCRDFENGESIEYEVGCDYNADTGEGSVVYTLNAETDESIFLDEDGVEHVLNVLLPQAIKDEREEQQLRDAEWRRLMSREDND